MKDKIDLETRMILSENKATIEAELKRQAAAEHRKKNNGFTQLDDIGVRALENLYEKSSRAGNLFLRLAREMDYRGGIVASTKVLAEIAGVAPSNVGKLMKLIESYGLIRMINGGNNPRIIAINPDVAWRSWNTAKEYAMFCAKVIVDAGDMETDTDYDIRRARALIAIAKKKQKKVRGRDKTNYQQELPPPVGSAPDCLVVEE